MTTTFQLQPDQSELQSLADRYWERASDRERQLEQEAFESGACIRRGEYTLANLESIVRWKSEYLVQYLIGNSSDAIRRSLQVAASSDSSTYEAMMALLQLRGVDVPMATAILAAVFPDRYMELDFQELEALGQARRDIQFYEQYLAYCRSLADSGVVKPQSDLPGPTSLHALDRALAQWARNHSN